MPKRIEENKSAKVEIKKKKVKKDISLPMLIALVILIGLFLVFIPLLVFSGIKKILPVILFFVLPVISAIVILLLSRSSLISYNNKKNKIIR